MFYCEYCDRLVDGDWVESFETKKGEIVCIDCHTEYFDEEGNLIEE